MSAITNGPKNESLRNLLSIPLREGSQKCCAHVAGFLLGLRHMEHVQSRPMWLGVAGIVSSNVKCSVFLSPGLRSKASIIRVI